MYTEINTARTICFKARDKTRVALYQLSKPLPFIKDREPSLSEQCDDKPLLTEYVVVISEVYVTKRLIPKTILEFSPSANEHTLVLPADCEGELLSDIPMNGSYIGGSSHEKAFDKIGFHLLDEEGAEVS